MNDQEFRCQEVENSLPLFAGGDLEPDARAAIARHLGECGSCRARAHAAASARAALVQACSLGESSTDLWPGIRAALIAERWIQPTDGALTRAGPQRPVGRSIGRRRVGVWAATWAAAAALLLIGFWLGRPDETGGSDPSDNIADDVRETPPARDGTFEQAPPPLVADNAGSNFDGPSMDAADGSGVLGATDGIEGTVALQRGLRRLAPGEAALSDSAEIYVPDLPWSSHQLQRKSNAGSPASLQTVRPIH